MKRMPIVTAIASLLVLISIFPALGQTETASLSGSVQDASRNPLPGVSVTATPADTDTKVTKITDAAGKYSFADLKPGNYWITASLPGFNTAKQYATLSARKGPEMIFIISPEQSKPSQAK